ncbi:hypothetical protein EUX98_g648 [Antrodiella citrinella]|uniref:ATP-dependent RNA helicase n=1 Tax=Antrodiella citrinella TaxID=2447956 RepID=A0A4S4N504_9APHY|nr:hypothetical protein EUX98_g648 [Antrodiella citrinella]
MTSLLRVYTSFHTLPLQCLSLQARALSIPAYHESASRSFADLGLSEHAVTKLQHAFPAVLRPTATQTTFLPALLGGKDVLLSDKTGSGKTFALVLGLWGRYIAQQERGGKRPTSTLILTPHRDLALQCAYWVYRLQGLPSTDAEPFVHLLLRSASEPLTDRSRLTELRDSKSPLTIGTPQAVLEVLHADPSALPLGRFGTVVVDEVDGMVEIPPPPGSGKSAKIKFEKNWKRHPTPTRQVLDMMYLEEDAPARRPQLVMMSATLSGHHRQWLQSHSGWFPNRGKDVVGVYAPDTTVAVAAPDTITHHAILVSPSGQVANIEGAIATRSTDPGDQVEGTAEEIPSPQTAQVVELENTEEFQDTPSSFNPSTLETIALAFALDVPRVALLVLPASAAVRRAVFDLRSLGVNAHGLDVLQTERGGAYLERNAKDRDAAANADPILLVSTLASTRGLDLPEMTHVFMLGIPEDRSADTYAHMAGRVGRFGRTGKVVSVIETVPMGQSPGIVPRKAGKMEDLPDEVEWLRHIFGQLGITPVVFEHFD